MSEWRTIPLGELWPAPWNYKEDDEALQAKLVANLRRNGQVINLIVRRVEGRDGYEVVNGNHRLAAMEEAGLKEALCCDLGPITEAQAKRLAVETNETNFPTDHLRMAEAVEAMLERWSAEELAVTLPYSDKELENFLAAMDHNWGKPRGEGKGEGSSVSIAITRANKELLEGVRMREALRTNSEAVRLLLEQEAAVMAGSDGPGA